ncbi:TetR/AcrR family transcriptional regulator [Amphibacillus sp. Q70]|uniref:TetR/AcrR family transcriptional regulator n=1 Tax=Amphibacillus sp. Q70 TaxID=3453416 RepID=UPI003F82CFB1
MSRIQFNKLAKEKRMRIIEAALNEFVHNGYNGTSTNQIVKKAGISKGSLFKYFDNKESLYFFLLDYSIKGLLEKMQNEVSTLPKDLFERVFKISEVEITWHIENPLQYKLLKAAFAKDNPVYKKVTHLYSHMAEVSFYKLLDGVDFETFKSDKNQIIDILKWSLDGFNQSFVEEIDPDADLQLIQMQYNKQLKQYMDILKDGF